jgi:hypothetical protein
MSLSQLSAAEEFIYMFLPEFDHLEPAIKDHTLANEGIKNRIDQLQKKHPHW